MQRGIAAAAVAGLVLQLAAVAWLVVLERGGPPHVDVVLAGGIPATLELPEAAAHADVVRDPLPNARPPGVVLLHGYASDRTAVSFLARNLARAGYAVLCFDAMGHGQNRRGFEGVRGWTDASRSELAAAVDFLRVHPAVDGERIAVAGHGTGADAALDFATRDSGVGAAVLVAGGRTLLGPFPPRNVLFLVAGAGPERVRERAGELASRLAGAWLSPGETHPELAGDGAVRLALVPGANSWSVLWSRRAAREIVTWLDEAFGVERRTPFVPGDARLAALALVGVAMLLVLPGVGLVVGRLVPSRAEPGGDRAARGLGELALGLAATLPLAAVGPPAAFLGLEIGDVLVSHLALAGIALLTALALRGRIVPGGPRGDWLRTVAGAGVGTFAFVALLQTIGPVVHRMTLTPERAAIGLAAALLLLPYTFVFHSLLRRGPTARATLLCVSGRVLLAAILLAGVLGGVLAHDTLVLLPVLGLLFTALELLEAALYATSRNRTAIALIDAAAMAYVLAAVLPVRV